MASFSCASLFVLFLALSLEISCFPTGINLNSFSRAVLSLTNDTLGVGHMKAFYDSLKYKKVKKSVSAERVANHVSLMFRQQQKALGRIKERVELVYRNGDFTDRDRTTQCCHVTNLTDSQEFGLPISERQTCDRVSGIASKSAYSIYGKLDAVFEENHQVPVKWQYFGSEKGILNQFPSSRPADCGSYDNRFRPWYKGSATPNPKDVVIVIKQTPFPTPRPLFEAADIILRTLNPRDRVALVIYNEGVLTNVIDGCYAKYLSLATPANVNLFQKFLRTAPTPRDGNAMSEALEAAYQYYDIDIDITDLGSGIHSSLYNETLNTTKTRDRAIVFLTDAARISDEEMMKTKAVLEKYCVKLTMVSIFILYSNDAMLVPRDTLNFYNSIVAGVYDGSIDNLIQIDPRGDLRHSITNFYAKFASQAQHSAEYKPVFMVPYYDVFGLEQLVMTLSTPCYNAEADGKLLGVASVDFTVSDIFASAEYFTQGDLSYAFVIDRDGLVLLHPLLPFPSTTSAAVYLDISTLEPQPGFEPIRESMINGGSGSTELESRAILSRGRSIHHGLHFLTVMCNYSWAPIEDTPFSVCVVVPKDAYDCHYSKNTFEAPINAHYHLLAIQPENSRLCRHVSQYATSEYSTVALFPEAFSLNHGSEWKSESEYVQEALTSLNDWKQLFKVGIMDTVAATANAEKVWLQLDRYHSNRDRGNSIHDYIAWRYIASSSGVMRIYPGTQIDTTGRKSNQYPWYHNAVADVNLVSISPPHHDTVRTGHTISLSKAIVRKCDSKDPKKKGLMCGVEAVMGMDVAHGHLWKLLRDTVEICRTPQKFRCMLIDSNAYVIVHPRFFTNPDSVMSLHLSAFEPFLMHDMYHLKFVDRVYCNNFQYNSEFTRRPRKQFFYELTEEVKNTTVPLEGGGITQCVFYSIMPVEGTNTFFVVVDSERSSDPICKPVSCPCDPEQPCSSLPGFCMCPCVEEIPPENYKSCLESFTGLCAHVCPPLTGLQDHSVSMVTNPINTSVKECFAQNCSQKATPLDCLSNVSCEVITTVLENGTSIFACREIGFVPPIDETESEAGGKTDTNTTLIWPIVSAVLLLALLLTTFCSIVHCVRGKQVPRVRNGRGRVNTASTNMTSVTDSSVENSLRRQDSSQEHSCSSQEALPQDGAAPKINTVPSITTFGSFVTAAEQNGGIVNTPVGKGLISVWEEEDSEKGEGGGKSSKGEVFPPKQADSMLESDQKTMGSFPNSLGTAGPHDLFSKLGESPDPSKAGGIWF